MLLSPPVPLGTLAPDFRLPGVDGKTWTRQDCQGPHGLLVAFICNHCPYVKAIRTRLAELHRDLSALGVGMVGISSNDAEQYPEDSFSRMQEVARESGWTFPYLYDESQQVARAYGAVCTPDFFGFGADLALRYRGRMDAAGTGPFKPGMKRELYEAMREISSVGTGPLVQHPSIGCSIKWKKPKG
jgi:peroxiredoxin